MSVSAAIRRMLEAGLTIEQALVAAEAFEAEAAPQEPMLSKRQARNKRHYERLKTSEKRLNSDNQDVSDGGGDLLSPEGSFPTPLSPKPQSSIPPSPPKGGSSPADFDRFWAIYPHKVGKRDAEKAFARAIRRTNLETMLAGLRSYAAKTDDRPWCNPATWLNQDRWGDEPAAVPRGPPHRERSILDVIDERLEQQNAERTFDTSRTIEHEPGGSASPVVRFPADAARYGR